MDSALFDFNDLFDIINAKKDGFIDEAEFKTIFNGIKGSWNSHQHSIMESILRDNDKFEQNFKSHLNNTTQKHVQPEELIKGLPHFSKQNQKILRNRPKTSKYRTLSIIDK